MTDSFESNPVATLTHKAQVHYPKDDTSDKQMLSIIDDTITTNLKHSTADATAKNATPTTVMSTSVASVLDDSTPSDSGVQLLDSISSEMNESLMSNSGIELDSSNNVMTPTHQSLIDSGMQLTPKMSPRYVVEINGTAITQLPDVLMATSQDILRDEVDIDEVAMTKSDIDNSNVDTDFLTSTETTTTISAALRDLIPDIPDEMKTSTCSTFDTDAIVFRRKVKKTRTNSTSSTGGSVKKRVSFHEDILKNTRTDNIHIEHGFITYKGHAKKMPQKFLRNSWCSSQMNGDGNDEEGKCYRNACSDVLDYGKSDWDGNEDDLEVVAIDNSGVFEYMPHSASPTASKMPPQMQRAASNDEKKRFSCKCSSSDSSESDDGANGNEIETTKRNDYSRKKSNSCDCIQANAVNSNAAISDNCYFSEPCIETMDESPESTSPKSVWRKEMKPKNSCLKKNRRETGVILEHDVNGKVKSFNVHHQLADMNNLIGSLKDIFSMPLPERGVPEGCEDLNTVYECLPEVDAYSPIKKPAETTPTKGEERFKRKGELSLFPIPSAEDESVTIADDIVESNVIPKSTAERPTTFRNKFIINCESTVFEHTGVFCDNRDVESIPDIPNSSSNSITPQKPTKSLLSFSTTPIKQRLSSIFSSFSGGSSRTDIAQSPTTRSPSPLRERERLQQLQLQAKLKKLQDEQKAKSGWNYEDYHEPMARYPNETDSLATSSMTSSMISYSSDKNSVTSNSTITSSTTNTTSGYDRSDKLSLKPPLPPASPASSSNSPNKRTRHLPSPLRRKSSASKFDRAKLSPDLFCGQRQPPANPMVLLSEEFDDLLTVTTTTTTTNDVELNETDIEVVDHSTVNEIVMQAQCDAAATTAATTTASTSNQFLRLPSSKSSLINRFLRNVTQKKINDATIKKNNILSAKYREPPKLFKNLYVKPKKSIDLDSTAADLNAEIAMEIEMNSNTLNEQTTAECVDEDTTKDFGIGVGEISADVFDINNLHFLRDYKEKLIKVFKLYTGYDLRGHMTPVLVFLTDKTLYVTDLVRNRLCNKYVLPYSELDVILVGPHGNTVLLSNSARDMQQVLLAGGPYPADGLVSSLELCVRRAGVTLPAIGQLTLDHLAPLQKFVQDNSTVSKNEAWVYYAVVSVPASVLNNEEEPLGPNMKGPLMHRSISFIGDQHQSWTPGYFLLKAGVLYMFDDAIKKLPSMVIAMSDCKGARRAIQSTRPHCFEILLKTGIIQMAAPDEYVASEWLQTLVQAASGLFELQERNKTLGCTLVITSNHLITLREDFSSPLRRLNSSTIQPTPVAVTQTPYQRLQVKESNSRKMSISTNSDIFNDTCSNFSTPTRMSAVSSNRSSPTRSQSMAFHPANDDHSFSTMSSIYGKNSGVDVKTCAPLQQMSSVSIPSQSDQYWCILEFSCQEVRETSDNDMVIFFATNSDMKRFLSILETIWTTQNTTSFPMTVLDENDPITPNGTQLFRGLNKSWEPLLSAALGYPQ